MPGAGRPNNHQRSSASGNSNPSRRSISARAAAPSSVFAAAVGHRQLALVELHAHAADAHRAVEREVGALLLLAITQVGGEPLPVRGHGDAARERVVVEGGQCRVLLGPGRVGAGARHGRRGSRNGAAAGEQRQHGGRADRGPRAQPHD
jgi:hypothetical protein